MNYLHGRTRGQVQPGEFWYGFSWFSSEVTRTVVAINDPIHAHPEPHSSYPALRLSVAGSRLPLQYRFREQDLPEAYYSLAVFHAWGCRWSRCAGHGAGQSRRQSGYPARINYFDAVKLDRRCAGIYG